MSGTAVLELSYSLLRRTQDAICLGWLLLERRTDRSSVLGGDSNFCKETGRSLPATGGVAGDFRGARMRSLSLRQPDWKRGGVLFFSRWRFK